jgi:hypothetical protein
MNNQKKSVFDTLSEINVNDKTEKRGGFTYLSWAYAWSETKKIFPDMNRTIYERENGVNYFTDGKSAWVKVGITINGIEHIDNLPVMDFRNKSISIDSITSFDVNKAIQRASVKSLALHGLGLYIYAGEDLPEGQSNSIEKPKENKIQKKKLTSQLFDRAIKSIEDGNYTKEELLKMFELNKTQLKQLQKI